MESVGAALRMGAAVLLFAGVLAACGGPTPPERQSDICAIFEQYPDWYDYALAAEQEWGTPIHVQMAFVRHESSYRSDARTPRKWFLWIIPVGRESSATGYAQAIDSVWEEYEAERGSLFRSRGDMEDALDFIGWYNDKTRRALGISRSDAYNLYLAYHEGRAGYRRGGWKNKPAVKRAAQKVARTAEHYKTQLARCEAEFECDSWYQVWPFCL